MNIYTAKFKAICPNNGLIISYTLRIETREKIMVETIISACHLKTSGFHEDIADRATNAYGVPPRRPH